MELVSHGACVLWSSCPAELVSRGASVRGTLVLPSLCPAELMSRGARVPQSSCPAEIVFR